MILSQGTCPGGNGWPEAGFTRNNVLGHPNEQVVRVKRFGVDAQQQVSRSKDKESITVSARKIEANRKNALKSTGPTTARGKAYSCRNAVKQGLFITRITDFEALGEDPREYGDLLDGLSRQYEPVGRAEEIEVERVAVCHWRLKRAWRYENAVNLAARRDFVRRELAEQEEYCKEQDREEKAVITELQSAKKELDERGKISQELKQRIFAMMPGVEPMWLALDKAAQERMKETDVSKMFRKLSPERRSWARDVYTVTMAIATLEKLSEVRRTNVTEVALGRQAIPNNEALDKILRYEAAVNRDLGRALDRLERLQRRRKGELIPPPLSVQLT